jgi:hypothetical protein
LRARRNLRKKFRLAAAGNLPGRHRFRRKPPVFAPAPA